MSEIILQNGPLDGVKTNMDFGCPIGDEFGVGPIQSHKDGRATILVHIYCKDSDNTASFVKSLVAVPHVSNGGDER
jgi:hypothetical protein